ncbi:MAG: TetR/AcrR family transcriptional regulator, partial [Micrococcales bacterium]
MTNTAYHHGNLKNDLLDAGVEKANNSGFDALSIRDLARETKVSPAAALRHFQDLAHLKAQVSQRARELLAGYCIESLGGLGAHDMTLEDCLSRFEQLGLCYLRFARENPRLFNAAFAVCEAMPERHDNPSPWELLEESVDDLVAVGAVQSERRNEAALAGW